MRYAAAESASCEPVQSRKPGTNRVPCAQRSGARGLGKNGEARAKNSAGARKGSRNSANRKRVFGVVPGEGFESSRHLSNAHLLIVPHGTANCPAIHRP